jgi:hypothetical protein
VRPAAVALACLWLLAGPLPPARAAERGEVFASPEQAAEALAAAWHSGRRAALRAIFGPAAVRLVSSGDPVAEHQAREKLAASYDARHQIETDGTSKAVLILGDDAWPYPIPLVKQAAGWRFDVKAGAEQVLDRRIGRNELHAIEVCRAYVEAQRDYAANDPLGGRHEYAQRLASVGQMHDGLYWRVAPGEAESPLGPLVAAAEARGYRVASAEGRAPFQGYFYRILTRQGDNASGGAKNYIVGGHMTGGFALVAFPATYGNSGVMTFVVNQDGIVFEKNLGRNTAAIARRMTTFDPDESWRIAGP